MSLLDSLRSSITRAHRSPLEEVIEAAAAAARRCKHGAVLRAIFFKAAQKSGAEALVTLDPKHFSALVREGDPRIEGV